MLKRLWLVISVAWAVFCLIALCTRVPFRISNLELGLTIFPFIAGFVLWALGRYVLTGRWTSSPTDRSRAAVRSLR